MGQFSWLDCKYNDIQYPIFDDYARECYLLVPPEFQETYGKYICESCYDGYGHFGGFDVYDLVVDWNRHCLPDDILRPGANNITMALVAKLGAGESDADIV